MIKCRGMWTNRLHPVYLSFCLHLTSSLLMHLLLLQHDRPSCWRAKHAFWTRHASLIKLNARVMGRLSFAAAWLVVMHTLMTFASHCNCPIDFASKKCLLQIVQFFSPRLLSWESHFGKHVTWALRGGSCSIPSAYLSRWPCPIPHPLAPCPCPLPPSSSPM